MPRLRKEVGARLLTRCYVTNDVVAAAYLLSRLADSEEEREDVLNSLRGRLVGRLGAASKAEDFERLWEKHGDVVLALIYGRAGMGA